MLDAAAQHRRGRLFVGFAAIAWSTAGLLQRELTTDVPTQLAGRSFFAVIGVGGYILVTERGRVLHAFRAIGRAGVAIAALLAVSSSSFFIALNYTSVANVLFMQALAPIIAAAFGTMIGDRVARRTWVAMAVALAGVALMVGGPGRPSAARPDAVARDVGLVRGDAGAHAPSARRLDGAGDVPLAGGGLRARRAVRTPAAGRRARPHCCSPCSASPRSVSASSS